MIEEKQRVASNSVLAAVAITSLKAIVGLTTGSLGILSEALHSTIDLIAAVITFVSVRISDAPADSGHHYGHGKVENFSAFVETTLLAMTCVWIVFEAVKRLVFHSVEVEPSGAAFLVMIGSMVTDAWRSRALKRIADKYDSQALQADALHFRTDIWSSAAVIVGLLVVWAGRRFSIPALQAADPIAALAVAAVVMTVTWRLGRQTIDALVDGAPPGVQESLMQHIAKIPGVLEVEEVRARRSGNRTFVDLRVAMARTVPLERAGLFCQEISEAVRSIVPNADVIVQTVPRVSTDESIVDQIRAIAARHGVAIRDLAITAIDGHLEVAPHAEFDGNLTLKNVHGRVTEMERDIVQNVPRVSAVVTHIVPQTAGGVEAERVDDPELERTLRSAVVGVSGILDVHDFSIRRVGDQLELSCHCLLTDDSVLSAVHRACVAAEQRMRARESRLGRVVIHPEPVSEG